MTARRRYEMVNRGRKGRPLWYVEDTHDGNRCIGCSRRRSDAQGMRDSFNAMDRENKRRISLGYHLPGL